jgi:hypothetical protein
MKVKILKTDNRTGITKGEIYKATGYPYDKNKIILLERVPDRYNPQCTEYISSVKEQK